MLSLKAKLWIEAHTELCEVLCLVPCAKIKRGDGEGTAKIQDSNPDIIDPQNLSELQILLGLLIWSSWFWLWEDSISFRQSWSPICQGCSQEWPWTSLITPPS